VASDETEGIAATVGTEETATDGDAGRGPAATGHARREPGGRGSVEGPKARAVIERSEYESGLRVVTEHMPEVRSVTTGIWVAIGSRDERPELAGASHFLEHLLFKGTRKRSAREIAEAFDAVGGDVNAYTSKENTTFYTRVLDKDLPMALDYLFDMLQSSVIRGEDMEAERQVILEEINMHEDAPDELVHDLFTETLWQGHPLGRPVLGTVDTITAATRQQVRRFWKRHYVPGNYVVAAAGNLDHEQLVRLVEEHVDTGPRVRRGRWVVRSGGEAPMPSGVASVRRRPTEQAHICVGSGGLARSDPRRFAFGVVNNALGGGMSSRLFQEIREKRGLAYSVYSYHAMYAETGAFCVYAGTTPARAREVIELVNGELDGVAENGLTPEELERAKGHMKGSLVLSMEDTGGRMTRLGKSEIGQGEILSIDEIIERIDSVTRDDARDIAADVLSRPRSLAVIGPFDQGAFDEFAGAGKMVAGAAVPAAAAGRRKGGGK
jgi:predicted Zn-dependent peptidase